MAGWGTGSLENDDAQKFLSEMKSLSVDDLKQKLVRAADQEEYLEAPESSVAVAAAEVVATMVGGKAAESAPQKIKDWIQEKKPVASAEFVDLARRAVERVRTNSELKDLWMEAEGLNEWSAELRNLAERLAS